MKFSCLAAWLALLVLPCTLALSAQDEERPRVGLVLSGGGARGGAHVGVLKALEQLNVPIDFIAGTSMGAIVGGFYAAGYNPDEIETLLKETDWDNALTDQPSRVDRTMRKKEQEAEFLIPYRLGYNHGRFQAPLGAIEGQHLDQIFHRILLPVLEVNDFDKLSIPFRAVATDLVTGEEVVLAGGSLSDSLRASMSVPGVFAPVQIDGRILVDGGMSNNLPVSVVRAMGADVVIAVDISTPLLNQEQLTSVLSVTEQLTNFLTRRSTLLQIESLGPEDILIVPELGDFSSADFENAPEIIPLGEQAAWLHRADLAALADGPAPPPAAKPFPGTPDYRIAFVDIDNDSVLDDQLIRSRLALKPGDVLDLDALDKSVDRIYSLDVFKSVTYELVQNPAGEHGVLINALARPWGPNYLQFGLELSNDFSGNSDFKLGAAYTRNALNRLGGELRVIGSIGRDDQLQFDFYQPVDLEASWFVNPRAQILRRNYNLWVEDTQFAEFEVSSWSALLGAGRNFSTTDLARLDYVYERGDANLLTGFIPFPYEDRFDIGELLLTYRHDSLDRLYFPSSGMVHNLSYRYADTGLGASSDYRQAQAGGVIAGSRGKNTLLLTYEAGYSFDDAAPLERWYSLGGLNRLSGLVPDQLSGRQSALLSLAVYRRLNDIRFLPVYAGMTLETGNVWYTADEISFDDLRYSTSLFLGAESPLGPLYFALGYSDNGDAAVYFYVGNPFQPNRID